MARTGKSLPEKVDVAHLVSAGVPVSGCPHALIDEVLQGMGRASQRSRLLPAPAVLYHVMALTLWRNALLEAVQASKSAISQARTRPGRGVMQRLAQRMLRPLAEPGAPGSRYRGGCA